MSTLTAVAIGETMKNKESRKTMAGRSTHQSLAQFVTARREALGIAAYEAARRAGVHRSYWSKLEAGNYAAPNPRTLGGIARALELPIERLYRVVGYAPAQQLPGLRPYLRAKYHLPHEAVLDVEAYFQQLRDYYGIPKGQCVFPPKPKSPPLQHAPAAHKRVPRERRPS
jgi:transcriptional regulator with XRE-family HTH domain